MNQIPTSPDGTYTQEPLPAGTRLSSYVIEDVLGIGGFGITYLGEDTGLKSKVALKEYFPNEHAVRDLKQQVWEKSAANKAHFDWGKSRFLMEAQILAQFKHPNIVRVMALFEANNTAYMVMDFEKGENLEQLLAREKTLSESQLSMLLLPLLSGLELLHNTGFIHRDIKPDNIFIREDGSPVLLDFGSARNAINSEGKVLTTLLTPGYSPLEQYYSTSDDQGPWTDIYALGGVLYRAVTGESPPESVMRTSSALSGRNDPLTPAQEAGAGRYSEHFLKAIDYALMVLERNRPQTIAQWRNCLFPSMATVEVARPPEELLTDEEVDQADELQAADTDETKFNLLFIGDEMGTDRRTGNTFKPLGFDMILVASSMKRHQRLDSAAAARCAAAQIFSCPSGLEAIGRIRDGQPDLVFCDAQLRDMDALEFLKRIGAQYKLTPFVIVASENRRKFVLDCIALGAAGYIFRPYALDVFHRHLQQIMQVQQFYGEEETLLNNVRKLLQQKECKKAVPLLERVISIVDEPREFYESGFKLLLQNQFGKAISSFRKGSRIQSIHVEGLRCMAEAQHELGSASGYKEYSLMAMEAFHKFNRVEETRKLFLEIIKPKGQSSNPFNTLGVKLRRQGDCQGAISAYTQALELSPDNERIFYNLARAHASNFDLQAAMDCTGKALELDPGFCQAAKLYRFITGSAWVAPHDAVKRSQARALSCKELLDD